MKKFFIICAFIFAFNNLNAMEANDSNHHGYCQWPIIKHISNFFSLCEEKHEEKHKEKHDEKHDNKHYGDDEKSDAKKLDDGKEKKELDQKKDSLKELDQKKDSPKESIQSEIKKIEGEIKDKIEFHDKK